MGYELIEKYSRVSARVLVIGFDTGKAKPEVSVWLWS